MNVFCMVKIYAIHRLIHGALYVLGEETLSQEEEVFSRNFLELQAGSCTTTTTGPTDRPDGIIYSLCEFNSNIDWVRRFYFQIT